jgi:DNA-binding MarR family transcriptional regulator
MATTSHQPSNACAYVVGDNGLSRWNETFADAWIGFLQTHRQLVRELDSELEAKHGLGLSALELLGRLAAADDRRLRLSRLAAEAGLSLSRVSRIVDALERRELVVRRPCPADARAVNAELTDAGLDLARGAQATHFAGVQRAFFDQLSGAEVATLAAVFNRFAPGAAEACSADGASPAERPAGGSASATPA